MWTQFWKKAGREAKSSGRSPVPISSPLRRQKMFFHRMAKLFKYSVVGGSADGSDSELLLRNDATPCNSSPPPPPPHPLQPESPPPTVNTPVSPTPPATNEEQTNSNPTRQLSFEEFECDVSVAEGDGRRQEFSFTLYGLDGHGRISKDDIAGLVKAIYDTLGSKIQAPACGQIKVKLTVSPDQRSGPTQETPKTTSSQNRNSPCCHVTHVDPCSHATNASPRRIHRRRRIPRHRFQSEQLVKNHSEEDAENVPTNPLKEEELRKRVGPVPHLVSPYSNSSEGDISEGSEISPNLTPLTPLVSNHRKRSGAMQRQQLLEIIQANMEKNNLGVNSSRKRHQNEQIPIRSPYAEPQSPYTQRFPTTRHSTAYHKPIRESLHPSFTSKVPSKSRTNIRKSRNQPSAPRNTPVSSTKSNVHPQVQTQVFQQNATRHVAQVAQQIINKNNVLNQANNLRNDIQNIQSPTSGKASKKHQLKHATREQDQARAMAQVVRWLEREFSQTAAAATNGRKHVHEHIHHHYHHYHAEALV